MSLCSWLVEGTGRKSSSTGLLPGSRGPDPCVANWMAALSTGENLTFLFSAVCNWMPPKNGIVGAYPRPPHYGTGLNNSFSQWSSVAPISCLLFLTVLLPTKQGAVE